MTIEYIFTFLLGALSILTVISVSLLNKGEAHTVDPTKTLTDLLALWREQERTGTLTAEARDEMLELLDALRQWVARNGAAPHVEAAACPAP